MPTFVDSDGVVLTECIAISLYSKSKLLDQWLCTHSENVVAEQNPSTTLLGKDARDKAMILRWMSFINMEVYGQMGGWFLPLIGRRPYDQESVASHMASTDKRIQVLEQQLSKTKYLAGNELTLADIFGCGMIQPGFYMFFDKEWRAEHPNVTRWVQDVYKEPVYQAVAPPGGLVMCEKAIPNMPVADPNSYAR